MSKKDHDQNHQHGEAAPGPERDDGINAQTAQAGAGAEEVEDVQQELVKIREQMFRIAAEAENTRKRAARDVADARKYALTGFARDLLDVADNLSRALAAIPDEARDHASKALDGLISGVELTGKSLHQTLERHGVVKISPMGEKFNPNMHQAVAHIPSHAPAGEIVEVIQPGYLLGDRTLRAAMVAVSSGQSPVPEDQAGDSEGEASPGSTIDTTA